MEQKIQQAVLLAQKYCFTTTDSATLNQLQSKLDVLQSSIDDFDGTFPVILSELINYCISCLAEPHCPVDLGYKITSLLFSLVWKYRDLRFEFQKLYDLASVLSVYLQNCISNEVSSLTIQKCLRLLHVITYQTNVSPTGAINDLITFCVVSVINNDYSLLPNCLGILTNLCLKYEFAKENIRTMNSAKQFHKVLVELVSKSDLAVVIGSLSLLCCLSDNLRNRVLNQGNINQTFLCIFNVLVKGDQFMARLCAIDLILFITKSAVMQETLSRLKHINASLRQVTGLFVSKLPSREEFVKLYDLCLFWCKSTFLASKVCGDILDAPAVDPSLQTPLVAVLQTAAQVDFRQEPELSIKASEMLKYLIREIVVRRNRVHDYLSPEPLFGMIGQSLKTSVESNDQFAEYKCRTISAALQLSKELANDDQMCGYLSTLLSVSLCAHLAEFQLLSNPIAYQRNSRIPNVDWSLSGIDVLLNLINVLMVLCDQSAAHKEYLIKLLQDQRLLPVLAHAVTSGKSERIEHVLGIILFSSMSLQLTFNAWLSELIAGNIETIRASQSQSGLLPSQSQSSLSNINSNGTQYAERSTQRISDNSMQTCNESEINAIIEKFKNGVDMSEPKFSQLIAVYEQKLQLNRSKEAQMQRLVDSKSATLLRQEELLTQYRGQGDNVESEATKLRNLIRQAEFKQEQSQLEINELSAKNERFTNELAQMDRQLAERATEIDSWKKKEDAMHEKLNQLENEINSLNAEIENEKELQVVLKKHYEELKKKFSDASTKLLESTEKLKAAKEKLIDKENIIKSQNNNQDEFNVKFAQKEAELLELDKSNANFIKNMAAIEKEKLLLEKQLTDVGGQVKHLEKKVRDLSLQNSELINQRKQVDQITQMLNSLGGPSNP